MRRATGFLLVYAGLGAAIWAVVSAGTEDAITPLQASAAPMMPATFASMTAGSPLPTETDRLSPPRGARWLSRLGEDLDREFECLALNIYWEARSESSLGQFAVAAVTLNRVAADSFPDSVCAVVQQGGEQRLHRCQFSWWCDGKSDRPRNQQQWLVAVSTATDVLADRTADPTGGALFFHSSAIRRPWQRLETARIGGHVFYR